MFIEFVECRHGYDIDSCEQCDLDTEDIDKCLNCGRYKSGWQLNEDQCCRIGCRNPNEY